MELKDLLAGLAATRKGRVRIDARGRRQRQRPRCLHNFPSRREGLVRLDDVVVVVADLKNSTKLGTGSKAASTASIYQATTGSVARAYSAGDEPTVRVKAVLKALAELYPTAAAT